MRVEAGGSLGSPAAIVPAAFKGLTVGVVTHRIRSHEGHVTNFIRSFVHTFLARFRSLGCMPGREQLDGCAPSQGYEGHRVKVDRPQADHCSLSPEVVPTCSSGRHRRYMTFLM